MKKGGGARVRGMCEQRLVTCVPFLLSSSVFNLPFRRYKIGLISNVADMCGSACMQPRSNNCNESGAPSKRLRRYGMVPARASKVSEANLDDIAVTRRDSVDSDHHGDVGADVPSYDGVGCGGPATQLVQLARKIAPERALLIVRFERDKMDVMDYV